MKICVAGLGLIGGSLCMALKRAGYEVWGYNRSAAPREYALAHGIIDGVACGFGGFDVVFVALPPAAAIKFISDTQFADGAVVADICGVKKVIEDAVRSAHKDIRYVGTHPMAGKEVSGIQNACADLFDRANMVLTRSASTDEEAYGIIKKLVKDMGFMRLVECSAEVHDRKIAYTSQLAHIVSNSYVKDDEIESCLGFTGGSFQDMTRIAAVDADVWAELYLYNSENVEQKIKTLTDNLTKIRDAVVKRDYALLVSVLEDGRSRYCDSSAQSFQREGCGFSEGEIKATLLHD